MGQFFSSSHLSTLVALFCCILRKQLSHILLWLQLVSVCFAMKLFSPSKYIGYKCYICFRPGMGQIFSSSHLYTLVALFLRYDQKLFILYILLVTACHSLFRNETLFSPSKYIGYKCYICFRPGMGQFFSSSHLSTLVALFLLYDQKIFVPYIVFGHSLSQSVLQ